MKERVNIHRYSRIVCIAYCVYIAYYVAVAQVVVTLDARLGTIVENQATGKVSLRDAEQSCTELITAASGVDVSNRVYSAVVTLYSQNVAENLERVETYCKLALTCSADPVRIAELEDKLGTCYDIKSDRATGEEKDAMRRQALEHYVVALRSVLSNQTATSRARLPQVEMMTVHPQAAMSRAYSTQHQEQVARREEVRRQNALVSRHQGVVSRIVTMYAREPRMDAELYRTISHEFGAASIVSEISNAFVRATSTNCPPRRE